MIYTKLLKSQDLIYDTLNIKLVHSYCKNCSNYKKHFSCPSHKFDTTKYFLDYTYTYVILIKIYDTTINQKNAMDKFYFYKKDIDSILYNLETKYNNIRVIIPGICQRCSNNCYELYKSCKNTKIRRYSYESLGLHVSKILNLAFNQNLEFKPKYLSFVFGIQFNLKHLEHTFKKEINIIYDKYK